MAELSDQLLVVAILGYLAAMLGYAAEYSFGTRGAVARAAERELVGAGGPPVVLEKVAPPRTSDLSEKAGRIAVWLTVAAVVAHLATVLTRAFAAGRVPWGNMYEFVVTVGLVGAVTWTVLLWRRPAVRPLGLFVALAQVLLLGAAGMVLYTPVTPLVPALNSYWLVIHVSAAVTASGIFLVGFVASVLHLLRSGWEDGKTGFPYQLASRVPGADALERLAFRVHAFAFPIWTLAIMCGAIWAEAAWGRYWGWDPKEIWSFIAWVVYAGYLHARATPSVKRRTAT